MRFGVGQNPAYRPAHRLHPSKALLTGIRKYPLKSINGSAVGLVAEDHEWKGWHY